MVVVEVKEAMDDMSWGSPRFEATGWASSFLQNDEENDSRFSAWKRASNSIDRTVWMRLVVERFRTGRKVGTKLNIG
jgi:hypothetical protein